MTTAEMTDDEREAYGQCLRRRARAVVRKLTRREGDAVFALWGPVRAAHRLAHRAPKVWDRLVTLKLASEELRAKGVTTLTELGHEVRTVLRVEVEWKNVGHELTAVWRRTGRPVFRTPE